MNMRSMLLGGVALVTLTGVANTADLYTKAPPPLAVAAPYVGTWQGLYLGLQLGYGWDWSGTDFQAPTTDLVTLGNSPQGVTGGLKLGYDVQLGYLVLGLSTDGNVANFNSNTSNPGFGGIGVNNTASWWGTTNVRGGLSAFGDHFLPYITGGVAYGEGRTNVTGGPFAFEGSKTLVGWNAGAGIETKITKNVSAFIEGKFVDLGSVVVPIGTGGLVANQPFKFGVAQGGIVYHFGQ